MIEMYVSHKIDIISDGTEYSIKHSGEENINKNHTNGNANVERSVHRNVENGDVKEDLIRPVPAQKWDFTICNYLQSRFLGEDYLLTGMVLNESTVFKVRLGEWRIMICDHLGLKSLLDWSKVERQYEASEINTRMLRCHTPWFLTDDIGNRRKNEFLTKFFKDATAGLAIRDIAEVIQLEFEKMARDNSNVEMFEFDEAIKKASVNVIFSVFLGEYLRESEPDYKLIYEWRERCIKSGILNSMSSFVAMSKEKSLTNSVFEMIGNTIKIKELKVSIGPTWLDYDEILNEIVYAIAFLLTEDLKDNIMSCLHCYLRLSEKDKRLIQYDANEFFKASNDNLEDTLPSLKHIHAFYMEVCRLHPLHTKFLRRAKSNFVLESTSGNFQIYKGDLLCGYPYIAQRDSKVFENPNKFILTRYIDNENDLERGCMYSDNSTSDTSYIHAVQEMSDTIIKIFTLFLTKCSIIPTEVPVYTGNFENPRVFKPLRLKNFHYER